MRNPAVFQGRMDLIIVCHHCHWCFAVSGWVTGLVSLIPRARLGAGGYAARMLPFRRVCPVPPEAAPRAAERSGWAVHQHLLW
jgi:hypothetical protein